MGGGFLHVAERNPGVEGGSDKRVSQCVRADLLGDPSAAGDCADDARPRACPVADRPR